jgi:RNA polymerase sigma-70 factor, ECF subfamily
MSLLTGQLSKNTKNSKFMGEDLRDEDVLYRSMSNPALFGVLVDRYQSSFLRKAVQIVYDYEEARDVVQETFVKIYRYAGKFEEQEGASFSSWAYKILINTSITHYQKRKRSIVSTTPLTPELEAVLPERSRGFEKMEAADYVSSVIEQLSVPFQSVLSKYFLSGKSQKEIADEEGLSLGAVKTRMHRAKRAFKAVVENVNENTE